MKKITCYCVNPHYLHSTWDKTMLTVIQQMFVTHTPCFYSYDKTTTYTAKDHVSLLYDRSMFDKFQSLASEMLRVLVLQMPRSSNVHSQDRSTGSWLPKRRVSQRWIWGNPTLWRWLPTGTKYKLQIKYNEKQITFKYINIHTLKQRKQPF